MSAIRWILAATVLAAAFAASLATSCAVDDEVVWISGGECTDAETCSRTAPGALDCDVDLSCTEGCSTDWDCNEGDDGLAEDGGRDVGPDSVPGDAGSDGVSGDGGDYGGDPDAGNSDETDPADDGDGGGGWTCAIEGGGATPESAEMITVGTTRTGLSSCPTASSWFRFDVASGTEFVVNVTPYEGELTFRIYAGAELGVVDEAAMDGAGGFSAIAGATGAFFIRVRSEDAVPVTYDLSLTSP
jgi:hypothetical protein